MGLGVGLVFFGGFFAYVFALFFSGLLRKCLKNSLEVRCVFFWVRSLFLWFFFVDVVFFSRDTDQVVTGRRTRTCFAGPFSLFCVPPRLLFRPFWPCVPLLGVFLGVPFWAPRAFGILLELTGLELACPFRGPFLGTRGGKGFPVLLLPCFSFSPFVLRLRFLEGPPRDLAEAGAGDLARPFAQVKAGGCPI